MKTGWLFIRRVLGDSMVPTLVPGMVVLAVRPRKLKAGDVVIVRHNRIEKIKRVREIQYNKVFLVGDNPLASTDSRDFGWLPLKLITAKVVLPRGLRRRV